MPKLSQQKLERHLFSAADILRGRTDCQDYKTNRRWSMEQLLLHPATSKAVPKGQDLRLAPVR